jgi:hypothetical protein
MIVALVLLWLYVAVSILIIIQIRESPMRARQRLRYGFGWPITLVASAWALLKEIAQDTGEFILACIEDK